MGNCDSLRSEMNLPTLNESNRHEGSDPLSYFPLHVCASGLSNFSIPAGARR